METSPRPAPFGPPDEDCPVHVGALLPGAPHRLVEVLGEDGTVTPPSACRDAYALKRLVHHARPGTDLADPSQLHWDDHPGQWPA
ncbi:hypothetical protein ABH931_006816 [Streptacidiphilus sp. MAP12-33]|uniref:hypothetical protein n=1 Tax=Streptacidiphilus sp. MAP12-33 TaxID=3156266 RepID=UPI0035138DBD